MVLMWCDAGSSEAVTEGYVIDSWRQLKSSIYDLPPSSSLPMIEGFSLHGKGAQACLDATRVIDSILITHSS